MIKKIILIVGQSGVGKDTLIKNIKDKIEANFAIRYITRIPSKNETNYYVDKKAFKILKRNHFFVSTWKAHGNFYGISKNQIQEGLNIISISRSAIKYFEKIFVDVVTIEVTLARDILYQRLKNRNREDEEAIQKRLKRSYDKIDASYLVQFVNDKPIEKSSKDFIELLQEI